MEGLVSGIIATIITLPFLGLFLIFIACRSFVSNKRKSVLLTIDLSTILFIIAVHFLVLVIVGKSYLWLIILILISICMMFVLMHWKMKQEIDTAKVFKGFWRFTFLLFTVSYCLLIVVGLIQSIFHSTSY
ncbi:DUF3397 domain-containing protein [Bacillus luteolus]|uniref:DUF3397 domain-containing protein n=1 Tax=Litchfieldia luteola TaxID=682179 RepID=A0ABR9QK06_9BACI|nr:DUF3397 domain-containing protein [Cytobacillus luteolus]MBE4908831.1 DUF3397 domain-containing protein [Cytobacillus luteolus]MBP1941689.1 membrane-associated HD superfamily phosphohydrolase [Cytobacillus luteolus]